jgi:uncharacterized protein (UPF0147 family)
MEAAREHTAAALATLAGICADTGAPPAARVAAANALLDRGHGKPHQALEVSASVAVFAKVSDDPKEASRQYALMIGTED